MLLCVIMSKSDEMSEVNSELDEVRSLFYSLLDFPEDEYSDDKNSIKRQLRFALNDLVNRVDRH